MLYHATGALGLTACASTCYSCIGPKLLRTISYTAAINYAQPANCRSRGITPAPVNLPKHPLAADSSSKQHTPSHNTFCGRTSSQGPVLLPLLPPLLPLLPSSPAAAIAATRLLCCCCACSRSSSRGGGCFTLGRGILPTSLPAAAAPLLPLLPLLLSGVRYCRRRSNC